MLTLRRLQAAECISVNNITNGSQLTVANISYITYLNNTNHKNKHIWKRQDQCRKRH